MCIELPEIPATELAARFFQRRDLGGTFPLWADGGEFAGKEHPVFSPTGHVFAALPDRLERVRVDALPHGTLGSWLQDRLPPDGGDGMLYGIALAYDAGRNLEHLPALALEDSHLPDVLIARYRAWIEGDGPEGPWHVHGVDERARHALLHWLDTSPCIPMSGSLPSTLHCRVGRHAHILAVERIREQIAAGDFYQANISRRLEAKMEPSLTPLLYHRLRKTNPAAFGLLWNLDPRTWLASNSPECLLHWNPETRQAHSYPIKGTRPRGKTPKLDQRLAEELLRDPKERAEHVMIVDLVRNDLGRVAEVGTVEVRELFKVQSLPTVHHLVSDVEATIATPWNFTDVLLSLFPGGSITGTPKIASMKAIERAEGLRRGFYTGSFGLIKGDGQATFNILIRTCVIAHGRLHYQTGGGIVFDSDGQREWLETEDKARALFDSLPISGQDFAETFANR
jgi:para-aminobenzoate synthetase component 1